MVGDVVFLECVFDELVDLLGLLVVFVSCVLLVGLVSFE